MDLMRVTQVSKWVVTSSVLFRRSTRIRNFFLKRLSGYPFCLIDYLNLKR